MQNRILTVYGCAPEEEAVFRQMSSRFSVSPLLIREPISQEAIGMAGGSRCVSVDHKTAVTKPILYALRKAGVQYLSTRSAGMDHIDRESARALGICVGNVAYSPDSVAEYTVLLMLMLLRHMPQILQRCAAQDFRLPGRGRELREMTVGIVGAGRIGRAVIDKLRGFGCRILAFDRHPQPFPEYAPLEEVLVQSDILSLHLPLSAETYHFLNADRLRKMKRTALVVNTGRGALIDTKALFHALNEKTIGGAALDVLEGESGIFYRDCRGKDLQDTWAAKLRAFPHVLITPHTAYYTGRALQDCVENTLINCLQFGKESEAWIK